jgi:hypothetical protein
LNVTILSVSEESLAIVIPDLIPGEARQAGFIAYYIVDHYVLNPLFFAKEKWRKEKLPPWLTLSI